MSEGSDTDKQTLIKEMIAMQKKLIRQEHEQGIDLREYYGAGSDAPLSGYQKRYTDMANRLVDMAHREKGSKR